MVNSGIPYTTRIAKTPMLLPEILPYGAGRNALCHTRMAASTVRRIHSERVRSFAFAASTRRPASALVNLIGTILLLASPFGSFGLPDLRFFWPVRPTYDYCITIIPWP
jgi:hypothetical protein